MALCKMPGFFCVAELLIGCIPYAAAQIRAKVGRPVGAGPDRRCFTVIERLQKVYSQSVSTPLHSHELGGRGTLRSALLTDRMKLATLLYLTITLLAFFALVVKPSISAIQLSTAQPQTDNYRYNAFQTKTKQLRSILFVAKNNQVFYSCLELLIFFPQLFDLRSVCFLSF